MLDLFGNLGGVVSIWAVPRMTDRWGWETTLAVWAGVAIAAALLWLEALAASCLLLSCPDS